MTLQLKRFRQYGYRLEKIDTFVKFPFQLDLHSYCFPKEKNDLTYIYELYGIVVHGGNLGSGHYTAYVKKKIDENTNKWFFFSDTFVRPATEEEVLQSEAYILFYEKT